MSGPLVPHGLYPWDSPGQNTGVSSCSFSRGSSWPRDQTGGSCIAGGFFTSWATREAHTPRVNHNSKRCMFTAAQFTTARTWKQTKHPSTEQWIEKVWYMYTVGFYSAIKKNKTGSVVKTWMGLYRLSYRVNYFFFSSWIISWIPKATAPVRLCPSSGRSVYLPVVGTFLPISHPSNLTPQTSGSNSPSSFSIPWIPTLLFVTTTLKEVNTSCNYYLGDIFLCNFIA